MKDQAEDVETLRNLFAAAALMGLLANPEYTQTTETLTTYVWQVADAMMGSRAHNEEPGAN
jgi:hypothetical protein